MHVEHTQIYEHAHTDYTCKDIYVTSFLQNIDKMYSAH